ncbi:MAG: GMC family oxidoreductase N-terminal domain-containing protein [Oceanospirillaceae bacterium]
MKRISTHYSSIEDQYDVIVIGSGYGGSISASRLSRAGQSVCLLERGKEILPGDYPDTELEAFEELQIDSCHGKAGSPTGLFNIHVNKEQSVVVGCGLGGTSLINANVSLEPDTSVFAQSCWPTQIKQDLSTHLKQGFDRAREMLKATPYPTGTDLAKTSAHQKSAQAMGEAEHFYRPPINVNFTAGVNHVGVEQPACNNCGDCISGCNVGAKNTTLMNYLPDAYNHGASIFCEVSVKYIQQVEGGWLVHYQPTNASDARELFSAPSLFVRAKLIILAAGTLGSTEIMLRSKQQGLALSAQLGNSFSGNGDVLGFGYNCDQAINGIGFGSMPEQDFKPVGPCITSIIDLRYKQHKTERMVIEEGSMPSALGSLLPKILSIAANSVGIDTDAGLRDVFKEKMRELSSKFRGPYAGAVNNTQTYLIMSHDDAQGVMQLEDDKLRITWPGLGIQPNFEFANTNLLNATKALGGEFIKNPLWDKRLDFSLVTVHPLGGCCIAQSAEQGVTNHKGQVFSSSTGDQVYPDLYICDGASIPTSLAVNPLLTISALTERCCALIAQDRGWIINYDLPSSTTREEPALKLGIQFTETMKGYVSTHGLNETTLDKDTISTFKQAEARAKAANSPLQFTITVSSTDLETLLHSPAHNAHITGTVLAPAICDGPLTISAGTFNLFVVYPHSPDTKHMNYNMQLTSKTGDKYYFSGYKFIEQGAIGDVWPATSTLYVDIYRGSNTAGEIIAKGILHIAPLDFAKQMTTMQVSNAQNHIEKLSAIARFGQYFAGSLWESYGGICYQQPLFNPQAEPRKKRPLRTPPPSIHWFKTEDGVDLRLSRYNAGTKGPVMLVHGLGVSSKIFSTDTIDTNLTEYLCANDYDVWLLDFRVSIDLACAEQQSNADQVAKYDFSAAINTIKKHTHCQSVQAVVHCYGATTFFMSMLAGLEDVRSIVCSQIATHLVIPKLTQLKTGVHLPGFLQTLGVSEMTAYTDTRQSLVDKLYDKAVAINALSQAQGQCSSSVCHRITFLYSSLFRHQNLNQQLHRNLHELFAEANITSLKHLAQMCRHEQLVNADGEDSYLADEHNWENLNIPIYFIAGELNECYLPKSTEITYNLLCEKFSAVQYSRNVIAQYGHIDCILGARAAVDVYPAILAHLEETAIS